MHIQPKLSDYTASHRRKQYSSTHKEFELAEQSTMLILIGHSNSAIPCLRFICVCVCHLQTLRWVDPRQRGPTWCLKDLFFETKLWIGIGRSVKRVKTKASTITLQAGNLRWACSPSIYSYQMSEGYIVSVVLNLSRPEDQMCDTSWASWAHSNTVCGNLALGVLSIHTSLLTVWRTNYFRS